MLRVPARRSSHLVAAPASALACPVCALVGPSNNTWAYQAMSLMLTLLPLAMIGGTVWWLARLAARADVEAGQARVRTKNEPDQARSTRGGLVSMTRRASAE